MKSLINKILEPKYEFEQIDFGKILSEKECLTVIFPNDLLDSFELFAHIAAWKNEFQTFKFYFSHKLLSFFQKITFSSNIHFAFHDDFEIINNSILLNFFDDFARQNEITESKNSILMDKSGLLNLQFYPLAKTNMELLVQFSDFVALSLNKISIKFPIIEDRSFFFENENLNFVLDINQSKHFKYIESLIKMIKQHYPANFYLTDKYYEGESFINVKNVVSNNLLDIYTIASNADFFMSDNYDIVKIFPVFNVNQIFFGKNNVFDKITCLHPKDIFEIKNIIDEILIKKGDNRRRNDHFT